MFRPLPRQPPALGRAAGWNRGQKRWQAHISPVTTRQINSMSKESNSNKRASKTKHVAGRAKPRPDDRAAASAATPKSPRAPARLVPDAPATPDFVFKEPRAGPRPEMVSRGIQTAAPSSVQLRSLLEGPPPQLRGPAPAARAALQRKIAGLMHACQRFPEPDDPRGTGWQSVPVCCHRPITFNDRPLGLGLFGRDL